MLRSAVFSPVQTFPVAILSILPAPGRVGGEADGVPEVAAEAGGKDNKRVEREGQQIRPLGVHTVAEREAQMRLDRQVQYFAWVCYALPS